MRTILRSLCLGPLLLTPAALGQGETARVRGEVRGAAGRALPGAQLLLVSDSTSPATLGVTLTDARGFFALDELRPGNYSVIASAAGHAPRSLEKLSVAAPFRAVADLSLQPGPERRPDLALGAGVGTERAIAIRVVGPEGAPLAQVSVQCSPLAHRADPAFGRTDADGRLRFSGLDQGLWSIVLARAGWVRIATPALQWQGGELSVLVRMLPAGAGALPPLEDLLPAPSWD